MLTLLLSLAILVNLMGCLWWLLAVSQGIDHSWAAPVSFSKYVNLETANNFDRCGSRQRWEAALGLLSSRAKRPQCI